MDRLCVAFLSLACLAWGVPCEAGVVAPEQLVDAARGELQARVFGMQGEWEFVPVGRIPAPPVEAGARVRIEIGTLGGHWPRRRVGVPVRIWSNDRLSQSLVLWFAVHRWRDVLVYGRDARAGEPSEHLSAQPRRVDVAGHGEKDVVDGNVGIAPGLRLVRSVRAGEPVMVDDLAAMPAVGRSQQVVLSMHRGQVVLSTRAVAQEDAALGERVKVLPAGAEQWIEARVRGRGEVAVED